MSGGGYPPLVSSVCTEAMLRRPDFQAWADRIKEEPGLMHRKLWEWFFISQALAERGMLAPGKRGLGFAVGQEALASVFASMGAHIVATDLPPAEAAGKSWIETDQHATNIEILNKRGLCDPQVMRKRVRFEHADMNRIPTHFRESFDFAWSACAFEHLGTLEHGLQFVVNAMDCLKPGGVAVHTTEFNLSSNDETVAQGETVIYRQRDIEDLVGRLRERGFEIDADFHTGDGLADGFIDLPPYTHRPHIKLQFAQYVITSIGLIVRKPHSRWSLSRWLRR